MRRIKTIICIAAVFMVMTASTAQTTLQSIRKGGSGTRIWIVLTFDGEAAWSGVSKTGGGTYSLYFMASTGDLDGARATSDNPYEGPSVTVTQLTTSPAVMKADVECDENTALSVVASNNVIVVAFNNDRFLKNSMASTAGGGSALPGMLVDIGENVSGNRHVAELEFDGDFQWYGFSRPAAGVAAVLLHDAGNTVGKEYAFQGSDLAQIKIFDNETGRTGLKTALFFRQDDTYSLVRRGNTLLIETAYDVSAVREPVLAISKPEESGAETTVQPGDSGAGQLIDLSDILTAEGDLPPVTDTGTGTDSSRSRTAAQQQPAAAEQVSREPAAGPREVTEQSRQAEPADTDEYGIDWNSRVSFDFDAVPIRTALDIVASSNNLNVVVDDSTEGTVTMRLKNVTLRQAMDKIVHPKGCEYYIDEGIVMVKPVHINYPGGLLTKVYRLKYAEAENLLPVIRQIVVDSTKVKVYKDNFFNKNTDGKRESYNEVTIQGIQRSSILVVTERPIIIREVTRVINELDRRPVQMLIHSKLVEMSPLNSKKLGVDWDKTLSMAFNRVTTSGGGSSNSQTSFDVNGGMAAGNILNLGKLSAGKFEAVLDFLNERTDTQLKSNPSLLTTDNQESSISVGTVVPVPRIQRGMGGQGDMVTFDYKEVNIQLNVTPHLTEDDRITMFVNPVIEEISGWVELDANRAPITDKRQVNSIVTIRSGETVVIGGLVKTQTQKTTKKVWLLGSIPLIGHLFQHEEYEEVQTDLMIFITPEIVRQEL
ncbi:hypothetical protein JXO52_01335 [bacterium]|nr:hypothetical protein [bacterium]